VLPVATGSGRAPRNSASRQVWIWCHERLRKRGRGCGFGASGNSTGGKPAVPSSEFVSARFSARNRDTSSSSNLTYRDRMNCLNRVNIRHQQHRHSCLPAAGRPVRFVRVRRRTAAQSPIRAQPLRQAQGKQEWLRYRAVLPAAGERLRAKLLARFGFQALVVNGARSGILRDDLPRNLFEEGHAGYKTRRA
jgi:hypothetical protein